MIDYLYTGSYNVEVPADLVPHRIIISVNTFGRTVQKKKVQELALDFASMSPESYCDVLESIKANPTMSCCAGSMAT
jgi:hypothetical protein